MKYILFMLFFLLGVLLGFYVRNFIPKKIEEATKITITPRPFEKYTIENLSKSELLPGIITIKEILEEEESYNSYLFEFNFSPNPRSTKIKKTTGRITVPNNFDSQTLGVILMIRGFVPQELYYTGSGTKNAANYFAENGYMTIAPDFLGYGGSDKEAEDIFESRFQTYTTVISLLKTLEGLKNNSNLFNTNNYFATDLFNYSSLFLWAHSNGGQIALTTLEITGKNYPTVLWAPVSKPFPYSILYYTDDVEDGGKFLRKKLAEFESLYDTDKYSLTNYLDKINASIQLNQGTADESVPAIWSDNFALTLKDLEKDIEYIKYPGADHNMRPLWDAVIKSNLEYYNSFQIFDEDN